jgi:AraC-like DNA-binding protein
MSKQPESSFLIGSSLPALYQQLLTGLASYEELGNRILRRIKAAHAFQQVEQESELARVLINIPIREFQLIGQYYLNWCKCRELEYRSDILERIAEQTKTYKAKALISRAAFDVYQGKIESAFYFYSEALKTHSTASDLIKASTGIAIVKSMEGFNKLALRDLENLLPLLKYAEPLTYFEAINSYAVELLANNRVAEAQEVSAIAAASPFAPFYPQFQETLSEATSQQKHRSITAISSLKNEGEYDAEPIEADSDALQLPLSEIAHEPRVQTVNNFISANLRRRVSLSELAEIVNLSSSQLSRLFKTETGISPGEYLIRLRMEKAGELLASGFLTIKEIMAETGYNNKSNFSRRFRRYFDLTPSEYRKRHRRPVTF